MLEVAVEPIEGDPIAGRLLGIEFAAIVEIAKIAGVARPEFSSVYGFRAKAGPLERPSPVPITFWRRSVALRPLLDGWQQPVGLEKARADRRRLRPLLDRPAGLLDRRGGPVVCKRLVYPARDLVALSVGVVFPAGLERLVVEQLPDILEGARV